MNRKEAKELLPIIQAFAEGKNIEKKGVVSTNDPFYINEERWNYVHEIDILNLVKNPNDYRIKPEQKYRPFKNTEECWKEMLKHSDYGFMRKKIDGDYCKITDIDVGHIIIDMAGNINWIKWQNLFNEYEFIDGTPMGVKIG